MTPQNIPTSFSRSHQKQQIYIRKSLGPNWLPLSLTDISWYIHTFLPPPGFRMDWEPPRWMPWLHMKLSLKHTLKGFASGQRLGGVGTRHRSPGVVRQGSAPPCEGWKNMCGEREKTWKCLEETIKQLHAMSCRIVLEDVFSLKCVTICLRKKR